MAAKKAVTRSQEFSDSVIDTIREPLIALDQDLRIVNASRSFYKFFKVVPEETVGQLIYDLGNKQWDIPKLRELLETILPEKTTFDDYEVEHDFAAIGKRIMLLNARQIQRESGKERIILLAIEDITERKQLEDLLTESEERYRRLFETASDGIVLLEKQEGKITHANPAFEKMLGYDKKESIGNKLQDIGILLDGGDFQTTMQALNKIGILNYDDVPVKTKSGQSIDTDIYLVDRARLAQCNIRDITERKQQEEELLRTNKLLNSIVENIPDMIFLKDSRELRFVRFNRAGEDLLGRSREELLGKSDYDLFPKEQAASFTQKDRNVLHSKELVDIAEEFIQTRNKGERILHTKKVPILNEDGEPAYLLGISEDITERKLAEAKLLETLNSLKKSFDTTIQVMISAIEVRDPYTAGHQIRSAELAGAIATEMGLDQLKIDGIKMAGSIHDIGKLSVPSEILSKPTKLTNLEFSLVKEHSRSGYEILKNVESPWSLAQIAYQHHERMDGSGYPRNLKGDEIFMDARIMAVADVVEAMASHRPYRSALGINAALEEIEKNRGILYDATVVDACLRLFREKSYKLITRK
ncbi:sensory box histidine kinase/response regulator [hydrocarbon metagenome]|uniref:Sensory box histidine kinase/response regulator n=1 Tax=hydrocarbon metagenome TaxID=938273 RepID=A0A0W8FRJ2_9ZZZZ